MGVYVAPSTASMTIPYKFSAYSTVAQNSGNGAFAKVNFATEEFDTGNNYDTTTSTFTAPVAGFYEFWARVGTATSNTLWIVSLFKGGTEFKRGIDMRFSGAGGGGVSVTVQLAASDTIDVRAFGSAALAIDVSQSNCYFGGKLVSVV